MFTVIEQYITQMKLRELRKQRDRLLVEYDALRQAVEAEPDDGRKLRLLYHGLQRMAYAAQRLHPDVANLDPLLHEIDTRGHASLETVAYWRAHLEKERESGRLRSEIVYIFGALLEEWAAQESNNNSGDDITAVVHAELIGAISSADLDKPLSYTLLLDRLFDDGDSDDNNPIEASIAPAIGTVSLARVEQQELDIILEQIGHDPNRMDTLRRQAQSTLLNPILRKEFADALSIMLEGVDSWMWPATGLATHISWTPNKWRLFLDDDLPTACLLEILGMRWQAAVESVLKQESSRHLRHLRRLLNNRARVETVRRELDLFAQAVGLDSTDVDELWADAATARIDMSRLEQLAQGGTYGSIIRQRLEVRTQLRDSEELDSYNAKRGNAKRARKSTPGPELALSLINAEINLARAAFPDRPAYVVKVDFKDFYASLRHDLLLDVLARFGVSEPQLDFFRRFLRIPLQQVEDTGQLATVQRGVPNQRRLSDFLAELVLGLLDRFVWHAARVRLIRVIDDVCILASTAEDALGAWQAIGAFADACGLAFNMDKCGAVCIGAGEIPSLLPSSPPTWLYLVLGNDGQWRVHWPAFEAYLDQIRQQLRQARSIIAQVQVYNSGVMYLESALAMNITLDESHRRGISTALLRFHHQFGDERQGVVDLLRQSIQDRFLGAGPKTTLPEAWLYWPLTGGGLGLRQTAVVASMFATEAHVSPRFDVPDERTDDWQRGNREWGYYYRSLLSGFQPSEPAPGQVMETLVRDFINRGAELTDGEQTTLSTYWRWVLYIYGPQILSSFGTFRFLITELVPLQLISQKYGRDDTEDSTAGIGTPGIAIDTIEI